MRDLIKKRYEGYNQKDGNQKEDIGQELKDAKRAFDLKSRAVMRQVLDSISCMGFLNWVFGPKACGAAGVLSSASALYDMLQ